MTVTTCNRDAFCGSDPSILVLLLRYELCSIRAFEYAYIRDMARIDMVSA